MAELGSFDEGGGIVARQTYLCELLGSDRCKVVVLGKLVSGVVLGQITIDNHFVANGNVVSRSERCAIETKATESQQLVRGGRAVG